MHDADHDALPVSLDGADATITNRMLVVATLTALLLAGSAMVYRARPFLHTAVSDTAASEKESGASSQDRELDETTKRKEGNSAGEGIVGGAENPGPTPPALATKPVLDSDSSRDSKSSRSKDRRRRGKDPLKEIMKGGKKAKILTSNLTAPSKGISSTPVKTSQCDYNNEPENDNDDDDVPEYEQHASPASSSASLLPDTHSLSRAKGKRAQRNSSIDLTTGTHSRAASNSEVSQKQSRRLDCPASDLFHPSQSDPQTHYHDRPPSYLGSVSASEDNNGRPHSRTSSYSSSSISHPHTNAHPPNVSMNEKDIDPGRGSHLRTHSAVPRFDENNQAHKIDLAPDSSRVENAGEGEGYSGKSVWLRDSSTSPSTAATATTTTTARLVDADGFSKPKSKSKTKASTSSASSSVSMDTTTTTGTTSMTSSLMMTRATSPSLSDMTPSLATVVTNDNHDNDTPTPPLPKAKNSRKTQFVANSSPKKGDNKPPNPWSWDGAGAVDDSTSSALDAAAANIIASVTGIERTPKEKESKGKESESYKKPPRLQKVKGGAKTFSAVATSSTGLGLTTAASHPVSLYSPTSTSFAGLTGSVSFSAASPLSSLSPAGVGEGEEEEESSTREREEEETFTFPTLNPTTTSSSAGSSRTRSSVADNNNSNNFNNNTPQINNTRRARPPTPSRSNLSSASHTPPPSSSSPLSQPASISSSSGANSGSAPNPNANGAGGVLLSTQTQLASLRGALEAARLREEKHKAEMERVMKEVDVLRWEHANSRRGEIELQTHVRQLMQQLQTYASLFASMAPQLNAQYQQYYLQQQQAQQVQQQLVNGSSAGGAAVTTAATESVNSDGDASATPDGNPGSSSSMIESTAATEEPMSPSNSTCAQPLQGPNQTPAQQPPNLPSPLHIPTFPTFQTTGINSISPALGVLSPSLGVSYPGSPSFFPYTMSPHPHALPTPHTHPLLFAQLMQHQQQQYQQQQQLNTASTQAQAQVQSQAAQPSPHQASLFSMHFPPGPHPLMMSPQQHHQLYALTHGAGGGGGGGSSSAFGMGSGPSSVAGTSSVGSLSPDLGASPSPGGGAAVAVAVAVNGKRRTRTRTQTSNGRMSARGGGVGAAVGVWEERVMGDPWVGGGVEENVIEEEPEMEGVDGLLDGSLRRVGVNGRPSGVGDEEEGDEGFSEGGFNELLADAILKRPESIRPRSFSKKDRLAEFGGLESDKGSSPTKHEHEHDTTVVVEHEEIEHMAEFTFPSLSGLGNVHYRSDSAKVNGDCAVVFGISPEVESPAVPSVAPDALASLELLEDDKASLVLPPVVDQSSVEPGIDAAPTESQEAVVEPESSPDLEMTTPSKEGIVPTPTESISHSELPIALDVVTLSSEQ